MNRKDLLSETLSLHPDFSARFCNHLLGLLIERNEEHKNISISPARLQAVLVLISNWTSARIGKDILEMAGNDVITQKEANMLSSKNLLNVTCEDWANEEELEVPVIELQTILWAQKGLTIKDEALSKVSCDFPVSHKAVDFKDSDLKKKIDVFIAKATHGLIKELDMELTAETTAIITDILFFKARWSSVFDIEDTKQQLFYGTKGKIKVPMMKRTGYMGYYETQHFQMVKLPYACYAKEDVGFSMRIYLPKSKHSFYDILHERWDEHFCTYTEEEEIKLTLPRFSVDSCINLRHVLSDLGLSSIYESKNIIPGCIKDLQIEQIIQQTKVVVNESGTEAAAVTSVGMCLGCCPFDKPKPRIVTINRPFVFEIAEDRTNTILFAGVINNIE